MMTVVGHTNVPRLTSHKRDKINGMVVEPHCTPKAG